MTAVPVLLNGAAALSVGDSLTDAFMTCSGLAAGAMRVSDAFDLGVIAPATTYSGARPVTYLWDAQTQWASAPTIDSTVDLYIGWWSDDTLALNQSAGLLPTDDTGYASGNAALSKFKNLQFLGVITAETAAVGPFVNSGLGLIPTRHASLVWINRGNVALATSSTLHRTRFYPKWLEGQ